MPTKRARGTTAPTTPKGQLATPATTTGEGGEPHQIAETPGQVLTTNQGVPIADDQNSLQAVKRGPVLKKEGAELAVVAPKIGGARGKRGALIAADQALAGAPSILFDAVVIAPSAEATALLTEEAAAVDWVRDAFGHLKVIGYVATAAPLLERAGIAPDAGVIALEGPRSIAAFVAQAKTARIWEREPTLRRP